VIYIQVDDKQNVTFTHYQPFHERNGLNKTEEELKSTGYLVESIPPPDSTDTSKLPILKFNPDTSEFYYSYVTRPLTQEEKIDNIEVENVTNMIALTEAYELILTLQAEVAELKTKITG
jgi:hypothetical protein